MKHRFFFASLLLLALPLQAQETGAAAASARNASTSQWQNWVFASSAMVTAAAGIVLLALDNGSPVHSH